MTVGAATLASNGGSNLTKLASDNAVLWGCAPVQPDVACLNELGIGGKGPSEKFPDWRNQGTFNKMLKRLHLQP